MKNLLFLDTVKSLLIFFFLNKYVVLMNILGIFWKPWWSLVFAKKEVFHIVREGSFSHKSSCGQWLMATLPHTYCSQTLWAVWGPVPNCKAWFLPLTDLATSDPMPASSCSCVLCSRWPFPSFGVFRKYHTCLTKLGTLPSLDFYYYQDRVRFHEISITCQKRVRFHKIIIF